MIPVYRLRAITQRAFRRTCTMLANRITLAAALVVTLLSSGLRGAEPGKKPFRAGAYAMDITPQKYPISVNGGMQDRLATAAHDRLHARCLVLDDGATRLALVVCDSCMIPRELLDEAKHRASQ